MSRERLGGQPTDEERTPYETIVPLGGNRIIGVRPEGRRDVTIIDLKDELGDRVASLNQSGITSGGLDSESSRS